MYYLHLTTSSAPNAAASPREVFQGPFASATEAQAYFTKLTMWFPEAMQEAGYSIVDQPAAIPPPNDRGGDVSSATSLQSLRRSPAKH